MNRRYRYCLVLSVTLLLALLADSKTIRTAGAQNSQERLKELELYFDGLTGGGHPTQLTSVPVPTNDRMLCPKDYYDSLLASVKEQESELGKPGLSHSQRSLHLWKRFLDYYKLRPEETDHLLAVFMDAYRFDKHSFCANYARQLPRLSEGPFKRCLDQYPFTQGFMDEIVGLVLESYDQELVAQLAAIQSSDQRYRAFITPEMKEEGVSKLLAKQREIDLINLDAIETIMAQRGYPGRSAVGVRYEKVAYLVIQHCGGEAIGKHLPAIEKAIENRDLHASVYPYLFDRYEIENGRPQRFGTQSKKDSGGLFPLQDPKQVNEFRREYGLDPLPIRKEK